MIYSSKDKKKSHCLRDGCGDVALFGCTPVDFDGCNLDLDGCSFGFDGCTFTSSLFLLPLRWIVILGLMVYGDWDYQNWTAKPQSEWY